MNHYWPEAVRPGVPVEGYVTSMADPEPLPPMTGEVPARPINLYGNGCRPNNGGK